MNEYVDNEARKARLVGKTVTMAHGAGGRQTSELIDMIFKAHFDNPDLTADDAAVLTPPIGKMAVSTDGFIVSPAFYPGGNIGKLSICGTVNDLARRKKPESGSYRGIPRLPERARWTESLSRQQVSVRSRMELKLREILQNRAMRSL